MLKAKDFRLQAWNGLTGKWGRLALITLVYEAILGACDALSAVGVGAIVLLLIEGPLLIGYVITALTVVRAQETKIDYLFYGFKNFTNSFVLGLLNMIFIALWSLLFLIPGIVKTYSYSMSYYILADHPEMAPNEARKASIEMMKGNKWRLFCLHFSFIGWWILCGLTAGILSFWVMPYVQAAEAAFYESLKSAKEEANQPQEEIPAPVEEVKEENA